MIALDNATLLRAVDTTAYRASLLLRSASHPDEAAIGTWNVGETANHLSHCYSAFIAPFEGTMDVAPEDIDAHNEEVLADDPVRDLDVLADRIDADAPKYLEAAEAAEPERIVEIFTGVHVPATAVSATLLGEALVHGYDIARAEGLPWRIDPEHALLVMEYLTPVSVHFVDPDAAAGLRAAYQIQLRGGPTQYWYVDDGELTIQHCLGTPVDCHISADPVTMLLMAYNRVGPIMPSLTGKVRVWGRRPWMALRLGGLFRT